MTDSSPATTADFLTVPGSAQAVQPAPPSPQGSAPPPNMLRRVIVRALIVGLVPLVIDSAAIFRIDSSAMTEKHRDRGMDCREEVRGDAQR